MIAAWDARISNAFREDMAAGPEWEHAKQGRTAPARAF